jgi:broad specificity phosphatase PhoE
MRQARPLEECSQGYAEGVTVYYLVRHGQPDWRWTEGEHLTGWLRDFTPLTALGHAQAHVTAQDDRLKNAELILSSPYTRALQTGAIISRILQIPLEVEFDLREWMPDVRGQIQTLEDVFVAARDFEACDGCHPSEFSRYWESREALRSRMLNVLGQYRHFERVIVTTHEMAIWAVTGQRDVANGEIVEFTLEPE